MQLRAVFLFSRRGESRVLGFERGKLNIVSGAPGTGKSAVLKIVDYCLGSDIDIPIEIRRVVSWYGIILTDGHHEVLLARPENEAKPTSQLMYLAVGTRVDLPRFEDLAPNATVDGALDVISSSIGLSSVDMVVPEQPGRVEYDATVRHSSRFSFQQQKEIAQNDFLFHGQNDREIRNSIHDTLPFLAGVFDVDRLVQLRTMRRLLRRLRFLRTELDFIRQDDGFVPTLAESLIAEAIDVGLISEDVRVTPGNYRLIIEDARKNTQGRLIGSDLDSDLSKGVEHLRRQRRELTDAYRRARDRAAALAVSQSVGVEFGESQQLQVNRGEASEIFTTLELSTRCPVCNSRTNAPDAAAIQEDLRTLKVELAQTAAQNIRVDALYEKYSRESEELRFELLRNQRAIEAASSAIAEMNGVLAHDAALSEVSGRLGLFLQATEASGRQAELRGEIETLEADVSDLTALLDEGQLPQRQREVEELIGDRMTEVSRRLQYQYNRARLTPDFGRLTVQIALDGTTQTLQQIGSAANHLAVHIAAHLGLHDWFINQRRPTLRFLMLDQPTQAYYPPDAPTLRSDLSDIRDEDRRGVDALFAELLSFNERHDGEFQIIVLDHAELRDPGFQRSIVARWRDGEALIPARWFMKRE